MTSWAWVGDASGVGEVIDDLLAIRADDPALVSGHGLFETMRVIDGRLPLWDRHLARLTASARVLDLPEPPAACLRAAAAALIAQAGLDDAVLRLTLLASGGDARFLLTSRARVALGRPLRLAVSSARRGRLDPTTAHKTASRMFWRFARCSVTDGTDEVVVTGDGGDVAETETGNVFAEVDGRWVTPPADGAILPGVARAVVIEGLRAAGTPVVERPLGLDELRRATRIAVTNAVHGPRPASLDGNPDRDDLDDLTAVWSRALERR